MFPRYENRTHLIHFWGAIVEYLMQALMDSTSLTNNESIWSNKLEIDRQRVDVIQESRDQFTTKLIFCKKPEIDQQANGPLARSPRSMVNWTGRPYVGTGRLGPQDQFNFLSFSYLVLLFLRILCFSSSAFFLRSIERLSSSKVSMAAHWAQKTISLPPHKRGCHLITPKVLLFFFSFSWQQSSHLTNCFQLFFCLFVLNLIR